MRPWSFLQAPLLATALGLTSCAGGDDDAASSEQGREVVLLA